MEAETRFYQRPLRHVYVFMLGLAVTGTAVASGWGWRAALGFLLGAAGSGVSFYWLHQVVGAMGPDSPPPPKRIYVFFLLRYLLLGLGGYVIVKVFGMNAIAALAGLFVPVAALISEILYELVHGT